MQLLLNGVIEGATIALLALAFTVVYIPTKAFHVALGAIYVTAPYVSWELIGRGLPWPLAILLGIAVGVLLSMMCEAVVHAPLELRGASAAAHMVSSLGLFIVITQVVALAWGDEPRVLRSGVDEVYQIGDLRIGRAQILAGTVSTLSLGTFYVWLRHTRLGLKLRALSDNVSELALRGHNVRRLRFIAFAVSGGCGATAALLVAYDVGFSADTGLSAVLLAVVAAIVGGRTSFFGPLAGGLILGVVRSQIAWFLSARWLEAGAFLLLAISLYVRPRGLFGRAQRLEVEG